MDVIEYVGAVPKPPSLVDGMPNSVYHKAPGVSGSGLHVIQQFSPAHYAYGGTDDDKDQRPKEMGTAIHTALLEPDRFASEYMLLRDVPDRRASEYKEAAKVYGKDKTLAGKEADKVSGMQAAVHAHTRARELIDDAAVHELSAFATDPYTDTLVRCRPDIVTHSGAIVDLKKARDARERPFASACVNYGYDLKAAFYCDVWEWATGAPPSAYYLLVVEEQPPHAVRVYTMPDDWMQRGRRLYREALDLYAQCRANDEWPAYGDGEECLMPPSWVTYEMEQEETEGVTI